MVHTPETTALRKHREEKMQGQGTHVPHSGFKPFRPTSYLSRSYLKRKTKPKLHKTLYLETMVQRVLLIVTITLEKYEVIYTTYNQKIME